MIRLEISEFSKPNGGGENVKAKPTPNRLAKSTSALNLKDKGGNDVMCGYINAPIEAKGSVHLIHHCPDS